MIIVDKLFMIANSLRGLLLHRFTGNEISETSGVFSYGVYFVNLSALVACG